MCRLILFFIFLKTLLQKGIKRGMPELNVQKVTYEEGL